MSQSRQFVAPFVACCPIARREGAAFRPAQRHVFAILPLALCFAGCASSAGYHGTGSLLTSGSSSAELASHTLVVTHCAGRQNEDPPVGPFTILSIGDGCVVARDGNGVMADPVTGNVCTIVFPDGARTLRVSDVSLQNGITGGNFTDRAQDFTGRAQVDRNEIEVQVGGDDVQSGRHVLYRFSGNAVSASDESGRCAELPRRRAGGEPGASR